MCCMCEHNAHTHTPRTIHHISANCGFMPCTHIFLSFFFFCWLYHQLQPFAPVVSHVVSSCIGFGNVQGTQTVHRPFMPSGNHSLKADGCHCQIPFSACLRVSRRSLHLLRVYAICWWCCFPDAASLLSAPLRCAQCVCLCVMCQCTQQCTLSVLVHAYLVYGLTHCIRIILRSESVVVRQRIRSFFYWLLSHLVLCKFPPSSVPLFFLSVHCVRQICVIYKFRSCCCR